MRVTIKDIAKKAGVSHATVSRALNDRPEIPEKTAVGIKRIAVEMGYLPSSAARSLKTNRSQALGVVLSNISDPFFSEILEGIESAAQASGYSLFIAASQHDPHREGAIVQSMVERHVDGVIICSAPFQPDQARQLLEFGVPMVVVNNQAAEDYRYSIYHDDVDGSRQVTRHLIGLGHMRIAYLGNSLSGRTTLDRLSGFKQEMKAAGLPVLPGAVYAVDGGAPENGQASLEHFLSLPLTPTAFICFNDRTAIGLLHGLQERGIQVPTQCSVAGFDNISFSAYTNPPLTTFDQPKRHIGEEAAKLVLGLLNPDPEDAIWNRPKIQILRGKLLVRQSTAPPPHPFNKEQ